MITIKEIILKSIELCKQNAHLFIKYMLILLIPTGLMTVVAEIVNSIPFPNAGLAVSTYVLVVLIGSIASLWISMAFLKAVFDKYENREADKIKLALKKSWSLLIYGFITSLVTTLAVVGGFILLIIPGIIFAVWFSFAVYNVAIEKDAPIIALQKSKSLIDGRWWKVFWRLIIPGLIFGIIAIVCQKILTTPFYSLLKLSNTDTFTYLFLISTLGLIQLIISLIFTPLSTSATVILYSELRKNPTIQPTEPTNNPNTSDLTE